MPLPQGYTLDQPSASVTLPPGYTLDSATPAAPAQPSFWDRIKGIPQAWEEQMSPVDQALAPRPSDGTIGTGVRNVLGSAASTVLAPIMHPGDSLLGAIKSATPLGELYDQAHTARDLFTGDVRQNAANMVPKDVPQAVETGAGQPLGMGAGAELGEGIGAAGDSIDALRTRLEPNARVSTMQGLRIPSGSPKAEPLLGKVEIAKPYLQGAENLRDLQGRLPAAKSEVYKPYEDFISASRQQPLGDSTVGDLYDRDKEITAQLGAIKSDPAAMQQAAQKGLTQADLINEQKAIRAKLFPAAQDAGVDAEGINKTYGALKSVEKSVAGKNTDLVPDQPMGFGRVKNLKLKPDLGLLEEIPAALKDLHNGRFWSGNPVDLGIKDAFRTAGAKPDFGQFTPKPESPLGNVGYPQSDTSYSRTPVPSTSEPEMGTGRPGVVQVGPDGRVILPRVWRYQHQNRLPDFLLRFSRGSFALTSRVHRAVHSAHCRQNVRRGEPPGEQSDPT